MEARLISRLNPPVALRTVVNSAVRFFRATILALLLFSAFSSLAHGESLSTKQADFSVMVAKLILQAESMGYRVTLGEAWRSAEQAKFQTKLNEEKGIGSARSNHIVRLAIDINLFRGGKLLSRFDDYRPLGEWWEKQCAACRWGGRFSKYADIYHFSFQHNGVQ